MTTTIISDNSTGADFSGTDDTFIKENSVGSTSDTLPTFQTYSWASGDRGHALLRFTGLSNITGPVTVSSATISLWCENATNSTSQQIDMHDCLRNFVVAQSTWNEYSTGNSWGTAGALNTSTDISATILANANVGATGSYYDFTSAGLATWVQNVINNSLSASAGIMMMRNADTAFDATSKEFGSKEGTDARRPKLTVVYSSGSGFCLHESEWHPTEPQTNPLTVSVWG